jgi:dUTP pyrophosphatase
MAPKKKLEILVKYHDKDLGKIEKFPVGDWIDLRSAERVDMDAGDFKVISLGISMKLPEGYEAHVVPRSSTFRRWGILQSNGIGIIDESYCGDDDIWKFPAIALRDTTIYKNERICQFRVMKKQPKLDFVESDELDEKDRGGFGSTGIK